MNRQSVVSVGVAVAVSMAGQLAAQQAVPLLADVGKAFPAQVFSDDFSGHADGEYPDGWQAEAALGQPFAQVEQGAFRILTGVNIHLIQPLVLDDFLLKYRVRGEKRQPNTLFCHMPRFRTGPGRTGYTVFHRIGGYSERQASGWKVTAGGREFPVHASRHDRRMLG
jgi:hypothetical protein